VSTQFWRNIKNWQLAKKQLAVGKKTVGSWQKNSWQLAKKQLAVGKKTVGKN
jgi:hypothetical protein